MLLAKLIALNVGSELVPLDTKATPVVMPGLAVVNGPVPSPNNTPCALKLVFPVPPLATGIDVPLKLMASVPLEVTGEPATDRKEGTVKATEVTVPEPVPTLDQAPFRYCLKTFDVVL